MTERVWNGSTTPQPPERERKPNPAVPAPVTAPALMSALQRGAGNAAVARWLRAESEKGQGPDTKPIGGEGAESVLVTATITEGGITQEVTPGDASSSSPAPAKVEVKKGEQVKFVLRNNGELDHEFILAKKEENLKHAEAMKKNPDMEHDDPNGKTLQPGQKTELLWHFSKAGTFEFACLIPGHREAGMLGSVHVK